MSRYYEDKSMRDEIDRLTEENKKLKSLVTKMNADKKRLSRKRMIFNVIGFLMIACLSHPAWIYLHSPCS